MRGDIWSSKEANNRWAYIKDNEKKLKTKNLKGISFINYISYNKSPYEIIIKALSPINNHLKVYINNTLVGDFSVKKGNNKYETKYIYEDSSKNLFEPNFIRLEHDSSFVPAKLFKNSHDHRMLTLNYKEVGFTY